MGQHKTTMIDRLSDVQDGKLFTWKTPVLGFRYLAKLASEQIGSFQSSNMKRFSPQSEAEYTLSLAEPADLGRIQNLFMQAFPDRLDVDIVEKFSKLFPQLMFVTQKEHELVAYCIYTIEPGWPASHRTAWLYSLAVDVRHRRAGQARFMIKKTLAYLKDNRVNKVYLHVYPANQGAIKLYESLGFICVRHVDEKSSKRNQKLLMAME